MMWTTVADALGLACLFGGAALCLASAIGIMRFDELYSRMHAATKPQVLGVLLVLAGIGLRVRDPFDIGMLFLVGIFQLFTIPASAQMLARVHYRTNVSPDGRGHPVADDEPAPEAVAAQTDEIRSSGQDEQQR